jgi:serine/threonine-protein kinase HSL1 (negative regulator of Swe1 kinase)
MESGGRRARQITPQRNWLAKLFNVKPPARFICFSVSKRKARREITTLLKDWKRYGIRDIQVDKDRNIVFGRVAEQNCRLHNSLAGNNSY